MKRIITLVVLGCAFTLSACGAATANQVSLTKADNGKTVEVAQGGTLDIVLEGNPTTGYLWGLNTGNDAVLKAQSDYTFKTDNPNLTGAGGKFTFKFQALSAGTATLKFGYARPFEPGVAPIETFSVTVNVK